MEQFLNDTVPTLYHTRERTYTWATQYTLLSPFSRYSTNWLVEVMLNEVQQCANTGEEEENNRLANLNTVETLHIWKVLCGGKYIKHICLTSRINRMCFCFFNLKSPQGTLNIKFNYNWKGFKKPCESVKQAEGYVHCRERGQQRAHSSVALAPAPVSQSSACTCMRVRVLGTNTLCRTPQSFQMTRTDTQL